MSEKPEIMFSEISGGSSLDRHAEDEYHFDTSATQAAEERGLVVVLPMANQLQLDLDSDAALNESIRRIDCFGFNCDMHVAESASGAGHYHGTLTFPERTFTEWERIALQAALGSDSIREFLNARRLWQGVANPTRLFETPAVGVAMAVRNSRMANVS